MIKKKITIITSFFDSPYHKNRAPYNEQLFSKLVCRYDINIIRPIAWTDILRSILKKEKKHKLRSFWDAVTINYPIFFFIPKYSLRINGVLYFITVLIPFLFHRRKPDLLYTTWAYPDAYSTMLLSKIISRPYIVRIHGSDINDLAMRPALKNKIISTLSNAKYIISPSKDLKNKISELGISMDKVKVIYSGINKDIFKFQDSSKCKEILQLPDVKSITYIGNMKESKGVLDLVKSVILLRKKRKDFVLNLIGKGDAIHLIEKVVQFSSVEEFINIVGPIDHKDLPLWINASNCICLPSHNEGVPNVLLESMSCHTNIVATRVGGIPEIVNNPEEVLVEVKDIKDLTIKLDKILDEKSFCTTPSIAINSYEMISERIAELIDN